MLKALSSVPIITFQAYGAFLYFQHLESQAGRSRVEGYAWLQSKPETTLGYWRRCLNKTKAIHLEIKGTRKGLAK